MIIARVVGIHVALVVSGGNGVKILVTGSTGLIGSSVVPALQSAGHSVIRLRRGTGQTASWNPTSGSIDQSSIAGADAVLHLAGANIGERRWSRSRKRLILESRVGPTTALSKFLASLENPPATLIVASAIGYYGDRGDEWLDESSQSGSGFLADVVQQWERSTDPAAEQGIRVVKLRFGIILSPDGGALQRMLLPFRVGLGGPIGSGRQYWSWVSMKDVVGVIQHAISDSRLHGPVNVVAPTPVSNREFTKSLGRTLRRPTFMPLPAFAARLALGEMADELLLYSARVRPKKLHESEYRFRNIDLDSCMQEMLKH